MKQASEKQLAVYDAWTNSETNLLLEAVAGSGKTTTLMGILERCVYRTLFLAFNKSIQEDIQAKIDRAGYTHAKAMTLHSLGLMALRVAYGNNSCVIKSGKNYDLLKELQSYNKASYRKLSWEEKAKTNMTLMEMNDVSRFIYSDSIPEIFAAMTDMDKYYYESPELGTLWSDLLFIRESSYQSNTKVIDFLDMIYLPVKENLIIPIQPYYLMIDECQDLNLVQHLFIDKLINQGDVSKWVAVGDRRQAIYGFSGSSSSSFDSFLNKPNVVKLPLDLCYRCPVAIVKEANKVYDVMIPFKTEEGKIGEINEPVHIKSGSMVICRNTSPILDLYFILFSLGKKVFIKGDDVAKTISKILKPYKNKTIVQAERILRDDLFIITDKQNKTQEEMFKMFRLRENFRIFSILSKNTADRRKLVSVLLEEFEVMCADPCTEDSITLCTIHKSKGLEADIVYILNENLIPSKFAQSPSQLIQEENLRYVARTRAKKEMYYLNLTLE